MRNAVTQSAWLRPIVLVVSAAAASLVTFLVPDTPVRPAITLWFLLICPGLALIPLFHLDDLIAEGVLCLTLSLAVDAFVGGAALYAGRWSMTGTFTALLGVSIGGALIQIAAPFAMIVRSEDRQWRYSIPLMFVSKVTQGAFHPIILVKVHSDDLAHYLLEEVDPATPLDVRQPEPPAVDQPHAGDIADQPTTVLNAGELRAGELRAGELRAGELRAGMPIPQDDTVLRMPVHEEQLVVRKKPVVLGKIRVHKGVETVEQEVGVQLVHEEAIIEHVAPDQYDGLAPSNPNEVIIPVIEERLVVQKQSVIKEYIRVRKELVQRHEEVRGTVRREVVQISEDRQDGAGPDAPPLLRDPEAPQADGA
jgi:uncharacterized protein (TIGR02271 family)